MEATLRQTWAFLFRGYHITRRYIGWVIVFNFYALVTSATVALIGVAQGDYQLTLKLVVGALLWNYLSWLYQCNRGVLMAPGAEENWTLSVQHSQEDVQRYVDNFAEMARDLRA